MKVVEKKEKRNDVLKRTEYVYVLKHVGAATPSKAQLQKMVADELKVSPKRVDIRKVYSRIGRPMTDVRVFVWDEEKVEDLNKKENASGEGEQENNESGTEKPAEETN